MSDSRKYRYIREELQSKNASYVNNKNKFSPNPLTKLDDTLLKMGETWYHVGHTLEDAEIELKNDKNFVRGYKHAEAQDIVNDQLYNLGMEYFQKGIPLDSVPANYIDKEYFIKGYSEALRLSLNEENKKSGR